MKTEYAALGMDMAKLQSNYILRMGAMMILLTLAGAACTITVGFLSARTAAGLARDVRHAIFTKLKVFPAQNSNLLNRFIDHTLNQ